MSPSGDRETQAARLFALALAAHERGEIAHAEELTRLAIQYMDDGADTASVPTPAPSEPAQPQMQQQQQIQPKTNNEPNEEKNAK